jgi:hypothetical protein
LVLALPLVWALVQAQQPAAGAPGGESAKLQKVLQELRAHGDRFGYRSPGPFCAGLLGDLFAGRHLQAVEPTFEATEDDDPRILKLACPFDYYTSPFIRGDEDPRLHFDFPGQLGRAPYRLYHVELDSNPANGPETVLYHTGDATSGKATGYTWVDLPRCRIRAGSQVEWPTMRTSSTNLLVGYRDEVLVLDLVTSAPGWASAYFSLTANRFKSRQPVSCLWN